MLRIARGLALAATIREGMPELHFEQVADLAVQIAETLGLPEGLVMRCRLGGLLHDVGKLAIPDRILAKRARSTTTSGRSCAATPRSAAQIIARVGGLDARTDASGTTTSATTAPATRSAWGRRDPDRGPDRRRRRRLQRDHQRPRRTRAAATRRRRWTSSSGRAGTHLDPVVAYAVRKTLEAQRASAAVRLARHDAA